MWAGQKIPHALKPLSVGFTRGWTPNTNDIGTKRVCRTRQRAERAPTGTRLDVDPGGTPSFEDRKIPSLECPTVCVSSFFFLSPHASRTAGLLSHTILFPFYPVMPTAHRP